MSKCDSQEGLEGFLEGLGGSWRVFEVLGGSSRVCRVQEDPVGSWRVLEGLEGLGGSWRV